MKKVIIILSSLILIVLLFFPLIIDSAEVTIANNVSNATLFYGSSPKIVFTDDQTGYAFYPAASDDVAYRKTTNGGTSWGSEVIFRNENVGGTGDSGMAVWFDQWTPGATSTELDIHVASVTEADDDTEYNTLDTKTDTIGIPVEIVTSNAWSAGNQATVSIMKATDGDFYVYNDNSDDQEVWRSSDDGLTWGGTTASFLADEDSAQVIPLPSGNVLLVYYDNSAGSLLSREYTDSGSPAWDGSDTTIDASIVMDSSGIFDAYGCAMDTSHNVYCIANNDVSGASTADIKSYSYDGATWTTQTDLVSNNDALVGAGISIDENTGDIYAIYVRGGVYLSTTDVYWQSSDDGGSTWSGETQLNSTQDDLRYIYGNFSSTERLYMGWSNDDLDDFLGNTVADIAPVAVAEAVVGQSEYWFE